MKALLDTSVLVAALVRSHPEHERCLPWLKRAHQEELELVVAAHTLAELQAVLGSLPVKPRISPRTARQLAEENRLRPRPKGIALVVPLEVEDYFSVVESAVQLDLAGGSIYDALIARAAEIATVDSLVTLNRRHFERVWPAGDERIREP